MKNKKIIGVILGVVVILGMIMGVTACKRRSQEPETTTTQKGMTDQENEALKNKVGKGTAGDVKKVEETTDADGNRLYIYYLQSGQQQKVRVRPAGEGEQGTGDIPSGGSGQSDPPKPPKQTKDPQEKGTAYEEYAAMSPRQQYDFYHSFTDPAAFYSWYQQAQEEYLNLHKAIVVGSGEVMEFCTDELGKE